MIDRTELARKHGATARMQGRINDTWVLWWVWKWGWTSNQLIQRLLKVARPRPADDFVKKGLLAKIEAPAGHPESHCYVLSQAGYVKATLLAEQLDPTRNAHYTLHESKRIPWSLNSHNLCTQHICLDILINGIDKSMPPSEWDYKKLRTDLELKASPNPQSDIPDFIVLIRRDDEIYEVYIEIELNQKTGTKLNKWLYPRVRRCNKSDRNSTLWIYTPFEGVIESYAAALRQKIYGITNNGGYDYIDKSKYQTLGSPKIAICKLTRDTARRSGGFRLPDQSMIVRPTYVAPKKPTYDDDDIADRDVVI